MAHSQPAQDPENRDGQAAGKAEARDAGLTALKHLRNCQSDQALNALNVHSEVGQPVSLIEDESFASACAGLNRALAQSDFEAQYDLLRKWSIPEGSPPKIRHLLALVPTVAPPAEFARALGERPRAHSFPAASIGQVRGIYSSGWSLVVAARESGRLKRLTTELSLLVDQKVPGADLLLALSMVADERADVAKVAVLLSGHVTRAKAKRLPETASTPGIDSASVVLAVAALQHTTLRPVGEELLGALIANIEGQSSTRLRPFLRRAQAIALILAQGERDISGVESTLASRLKYWVPATGGSGESNSPDLSGASWLVHENHILQLSGSSDDRLLFRFPLTGDFQLQSELQTGNQFDADGGLVYGGIQFSASGSTGQISILDHLGKQLDKRFCPFAHRPGRAAFNRMSIAASPDSVTMAVNLHPMWVDRNGFQSSPWLALSGSGDTGPLYRNIRITGHPVIPRSIRLSDGNLLRSWQPRATSERSSTAPKLESAWEAAQGVIRTRPRERSDSPDQLDESLLSFERPLLRDETVKYEFFYEPGKVDVSPAVGRVAFLLQSEGVRIRWVTSDNNEWTGLTVDHAIVEPLCRRGPRPLPFKPDHWNTISVSRTDQTITLSLNGVEIYERIIDWVGDTRFGLYRHDKNADVKVREVVLTGDWPKSLPQEAFDNAAVTEGEPLAAIDRRAFNKIFREEILTENVADVRRRGLAMPVGERFQYLTEWVLPGPDHPGFRMAGEFTPTQPAPVVSGPVDDHRGVAGPALERSDAGGQIVSPVFDWLDAAKETGRLAECRQRIESVAVSDDEFQQRARVALLLLLSLEENAIKANEANHVESGKNDASEKAQAAISKADQIEADWETLFALIKNAKPQNVENHWPEMLLAVRGANNFPDDRQSSTLIVELTLKWMHRWQRPDLARWHNHLAAMYGRVLLRKWNGSNVGSDSSGRLRDWLPVTAAKAATTGQGYPELEWVRRDKGVVKVSGHDSDYLFYRLPLQGDFEVQCNIVQPTQYPAQILVAGIFSGPTAGFNGIETGTFRSEKPVILFEPSLTNVGKPIRFRAAIRGKTRTIDLNGRRVSTETLTGEVDPWIAIRSSGRLLSSISDLRITGHPKIPDAVRLSGSQDLTGWLEYHEEGHWEHVNDPDSSGWIIDRLNPSFAGMHAESLLRYQRPMVEDGSIEYEFFYEPGAIEVHPALDRLAFVLNPSGVREHWITDGRHERTDLAPDNLSDAPSHRIGPAKLPLVPGTWNRLELTLRGTTVRVVLNGTAVYERIPGPSNRHTFGLFHDVGATEARVRNVVLRGEWPKTLPDVPDQELADKTTDWLDADIPQLKSVFEHDFATEGLPSDYFDTTPTSVITATEEGAVSTQSSTRDYVAWDIIPRLTLSGDFDIEATFSKLEGTFANVEPGIKETRGLVLRVIVNEPQKPVFDVHRTSNRAPQNLTYAARSLVVPDLPGDGQWNGNDDACESDSGRVRLSRRGNKMYHLFAEGDVGTGRLIGTFDVSRSDTEKNGSRLHTFAQYGTSTVIWKKLVIRAEKIYWNRDPSKTVPPVLKVVQADGSGSRTIAAPESSGFKQVSSPEWSSDSRKIVMDMSNGPRSTSHIFVVNADGSGLRKLGPGCMPSFSGDGRRIAFSMPGSGIMTMKSDGTDRQVIDRSGWGAQRSPDGKSIAYGKGGNITLVDIATKKTRLLLTAENATRYNYVYWNLSWSHDSRSIAFKAMTRATGQDELAVAEVDTSGSLQVLLPNASAVNPDCTFSPDNERVIAAIDSGGDFGPRLYAINRKRPESPELLDFIPAGPIIEGASWSPDGKSIAVAIQENGPSTEWTAEMKSRPVKK